MKKGIGITLVVLASLAILYLHLFTIFFIYANHGMAWAVVAFFLPPLPEFILAGASIFEKGIFNEYIIDWVIAIVVLYSGMGLFQSSEKISVE